MSHEHDLDPEYLYPSDADVLDLYAGDDGELRMTLAMPCPECGDPLALDASVDSVEEGDFDLPLDDELYD